MLKMKPGFHTVSAKTLSKFAQEVFKTLNKMPPAHHARLIILSGNLGSGKTAFVQLLAKLFGVKSHVLSPTFVFVHEYKTEKISPFDKIIHADAYRMETKRDVLAAGIRHYLKDPNNLVLIEWGERVKKWISRPDMLIEFRHHKPHLRKVRITRSK